MYKHLIFLFFSFLMLACSTNNKVKTQNNQFIDAVPTDFKGTLTSHNAVRATLGLNPLRWSNTLATYAKQWARHQARTQNCFMQHRPHDAGRFKQIYGENLFWASPKRWSDGRVELQHIRIGDVVKAWANEVADYDYQSNSCRAGEQCGHYTQIVWRESQAVGCAKVVCGDQSQLWVCNYNPPGNYIGEKPY
ncbi:MAG: pathogenesis-related family 1 protein [Cocleimonas sp.]|nr:pathogenesis-related family 1 protein [Cocleimonas sp.]